MLFSTPGGGRFSRAPPFTKTLQQATTFSLTSVKTRLIDVGPPAGLSHLPGDVLNPPRRLHLPGPFLGPFRPVRYQATLRRPRRRPGRSEEYVSLQTPPVRILHWSQQCFPGEASLISQMVH